MNRLRKDRMLVSKIKSTKAWQELDDVVSEVENKDAVKSENNLKVLTQ